MKSKYNFSKTLYQLRTDNNLTQSALAIRTNIKQQNISRWEAGSNLPNIDECVILADFFGITIDELIGRII